MRKGETREIQVRPGRNGMWRTVEGPEKGSECAADVSLLNASQAMPSGGNAALHGLCIQRHLLVSGCNFGCLRER